MNKSLIPMSVAVMLFTALNVQAWYDPSTGRWASRDPIGERGGLNIYGFVKNNSISLYDSFGLSESSEPCQKCGVQSARLDVLGIVFTLNEFHFDVIQKVVLRNDGIYVSGCCAIYQLQKSKDIINGTPKAKGSNGSPLDGQWHVDNYSWTGDVYDDSSTLEGISQNSSSDPGTFLSVDMPGIGPMPDGTTFSDETELKLVIRDRCHHFKKVATSNTIQLSAYGTWPDINYSYSQ